jgi:hypothetical protein
MTTSAIRLGSLTAQPGTRVTGIVHVDVGVATLERSTAPQAGVVIFLVSSLAMNAGDPLLALAG